MRAQNPEILKEISRRHTVLEKGPFPRKPSTIIIIIITINNNNNNNNNTTN